MTPLCRCFLDLSTHLSARTSTPFKRRMIDTSLSSEPLKEEDLLSWRIVKASDATHAAQKLKTSLGNERLWTYRNLTNNSAPPALKVCFCAALSDMQQLMDMATAFVCWDINKCELKLGQRATKEFIVFLETFRMNQFQTGDYAPAVQLFDSR